MHPMNIVKHRSKLFFIHKQKLKSIVLLSTFLLIPSIKYYS